MEWNDLLADGYGRVLEVLERVLKGLTQDDLDWQPRPDCNSIGWLTWHLTRQQDVLTGLGHRAVVGRYHQNRAVHLRCTGDHVLDIISMARTIHMRIMAIVCLVLNVCRGNRDPALFFLWRFVDLIKRHKLRLAF